MNKKYQLTEEQKKKYSEKAKLKYLELSDADKEIKKNYKREYRLKNREKINKKTRELKKIKLQDPEYRKKVREARKLAKKIRKKNDPISAIGKHIKDSARNRGIEAPHSPLEYKNWYIEQIKVCHFCGNTNETIKNYLELDGEKVTVNQNRLQIDRIDSSKGYLLNNLTLACSICNTHKSDIISAKDFEEIAKTYIAPKIKKKLETAN
jgi:hypothetical protein